MPAHAGPTTAAAASSTSTRRRAPPSTPAKSRTRASISATRRSCRTCSRSSPGRRSTFPNNDRTYHNVFSLSKTRSFDLGRYAAGHSKSVRFDRPGIVRVFCDIHSHMSAFILVFAHRYFAVTDDDGAYHIDNVPPGTYTVVAWNEAMAHDIAARRPCRTAGGEVELSFLFGSSDEDPLVADQPHLPRQRGARGR